MEIKIPRRLNGESFYNEILPKIYQTLLAKKFDIVFNMYDTELANPEGLVNFLSACALIRMKYKYIPELILPKSENLLSYLDLCNFFSISQIPNSEVLRFQRIYLRDRKKKFYIPKIYLISSHTSLDAHQTNVSKIIYDLIKEKLGDANNLEEREIYEKLKNSFNQLIRNVVEHNFINNPLKACGYYMAQKMPYDTIELVCSDIGKGFRNRILEMINENKDENISKYKGYETLLRDNRYLFKKNDKNPNYLAITTAVNYRENSLIPGIAYIKEFALYKGGSLKIHSGNYTVLYNNEGINSSFHESHFTGSHIKLEIPLN